MWIGVLILFWKLFSEKNIGLTLSYAWNFGVLVPHLLATTKTPSATLIGMPAFLMILGELLTRCWKMKKRLNLQAHSHAGTYRISPNREHLSTLAVRVSTWMSVLYLTIFLPYQIWEAWEVTDQNRNHHTLSEIAEFVQTQLPANAVLLVDIDMKTKLNQDDHLRLMFLCSKTAHPLYEKETWKTKAKQVRKTGGIPYLVSFREWPLTVVFKSQADGRTIYYDFSEMPDETP